MRSPDLIQAKPLEGQSSCPKSSSDRNKLQTTAAMLDGSNEIGDMTRTNQRHGITAVTVLWSRGSSQNQRGEKEKMIDVVPPTFS